MDWRVPDGDETRTWRRGWGGPHASLEQDWWLASAEHEAACYRSIGAFTCTLDARAYVHGWPFEREPVDPPEEVQARRVAHSAKGDAALDAGSDLWEAEIRPEVEAIHRDLRRRRPRKDTNLPGLVAHVERCMEAAAHIMGDLHWRMAFGIPGDWSTDYPQLTGGTVADAAEFLQGVDHATSRLLKRLRRLARLQVAGDPAFDDELAELLVRHGTRTGRGYGSSSGFRDGTWAIEPGVVLELIAAYAKADLDDLDRREQAARATRRNAERRLRRRHAGDPEVWPKLERAHRAALARCRAMENHNHLMEQETEGMLRMAIHRLGTAFVAAGCLDHHDDVFHLHVHELRELASHPTDARATVAARHAELEEQARLEPPPFLGKAPDRPSFGDPGERPPVAEHPADELHGTAASPGTATGRARVVPDTAGFPDVEPGDILVARDAGPAWTPIFALLGGLVLDQGWTIQHAAIVCRELGIPCVLATGTATTAIADGSTVTVDGEAGLVRLVG